MGLKAGFLKNAVNPAGFVFHCDVCSREGHAATPFLEHAKKDAVDAGWRMLSDGASTIEYCPVCAAAALERLVNEMRPSKKFCPKNA